MSKTIRSLGAVAAMAGILLAASGCSITTGLMPTAPPGVTQQLLIRSLERGLNQLDLSRLSGKSVDIEIYTHAGNEPFVTPFVTSWLKAQGVRTVPTNPDLKLKVFATVYGTDRGETLVGLPAFQAPLVNVPFPEIALFKWTRNRGQTELRVFTFDGKTEDYVDQLPLTVGRSKSDDFIVLLFIGFSVSDTEKPVDPVR
jgi:hypothetical protein